MFYLFVKHVYLYILSLSVSVIILFVEALDAKFGTVTNFCMGGGMTAKLGTVTNFCMGGGRVFWPQKDGV